MILRFIGLWMAYIIGAPIILLGYLVGIVCGVCECIGDNLTWSDLGGMIKAGFVGLLSLHEDNMYWVKYNTTIYEED